MNWKRLSIWALILLITPFLFAQHDKLLEKADSLMASEEYKAVSSIYKKLSINYLNAQKYDDYLKTSILLAKNLDYLEKSETAISVLEKAIKTTQKDLGHDSIVAVAYHKLANIEYNSIENFELAILNWQKALQIREVIFEPNHLDIIKLYRNIGNGFLNLKQWEKGKIHFQKAADLHLSREKTDAIHLAKTYKDLGRVYTILEDFNKAEKYLKVALSDYKKLFAEEPWELYFAYENVLDFYRIKGDYPKMVSSQKEILQKYETVTGKLEDDYIKIANGYNNLGLGYDLMDSLSMALAFYKKSMEINKQYVEKNGGALAINYNNLSSIYKKQRQYNKALTTINTAIDYDIKSGNQIGLAINLNDKSTILLNQGKEKLALETIEAAIQLINPSNNNGLVLDKPLLISLLGDKLQILKLLGKKDINFLKKAPLVINQISSLFNQIRIEYQSDASKSFLSKKSKPIFENAIQINLTLFKSIGNHDYLRQAFQMAEYSKSIILMDALQQAQAKRTTDVPTPILDKEEELQQKIAQKEKALFLKQGDVNSLNSDLIILNRNLEKLTDTFKKEYPKYHQVKYSTKLPTISDFTRSLDGSLLEYFVGDNTIYAFILQGNNSKIEVIEIPLDFPLAQWVKQLRESLYNYHLSGSRSENLFKAYSDTMVVTSQLLYQKIFAPILTKTSLPKQLIIVPDGVLGYLPFELLIRDLPEDNTLFGSHQYLLKDHQISYNYSAALWQEMQQKKGQKSSGNYLAFAPSFQDSSPISQRSVVAIRGGLGALLFNASEVEAIQQQIGGIIFTGKDATKANFFQYAPNYKIIHLSTHGKANDKVGDYAYLAFSPSSDSTDYELLYNRDLYNLRLNTDMVVLSACETGIGELQKGEGIISLARGFSYAGAKSIITTLWSVNDAKTKELMENFYTYIKAGQTKDAALRQAKLDFIAQHSHAAHPFFWAGFIGIGDMEVIELGNTLRFMWWGFGIVLIGLIIWCSFFTKKKRQKN